VARDCHTNAPVSYQQSFKCCMATELNHSIGCHASNDGALDQPRKLPGVEATANVTPVIGRRKALQVVICHCERAQPIAPEVCRPLHSSQDAFQRAGARCTPCLCCYFLQACQWWIAGTIGPQMWHRMHGIAVAHLLLLYPTRCFHPVSSPSSGTQLVTSGIAPPTFIMT
jgi:hypothetical protein